MIESGNPALPSRMTAGGPITNGGNNSMTTFAVEGNWSIPPGIGGQPAHAALEDRMKIIPKTKEPMARVIGFMVTPSLGETRRRFCRVNQSSFGKLR